MPRLCTNFGNINRVFIAGVSGLLGSSMAAEWRNRFCVAGCFLAHSPTIDGVEAVRIDLASQSLHEILSRFSPDLVVNCAGLTDVDACEADPSRARLLNETMARAVADACVRKNIRLVHISTDHLFDGTVALASEETVPRPVNVYGATKWAGERAVAELCPEALIVRTNFFGWGSPHRVSFSDWVLDILRGGKSQAMFNDVYFSPILIQDLLEIILSLVGRDARGLFHVCGCDRVSKFEFALKMAEVFGLYSGNLWPASISQAGLRAPRPHDMSLSCRKMEGLLGFSAPSLDAGLRKLKSIQPPALDCFLPAC